MLEVRFAPNEALSEFSLYPVGGLRSFSTLSDKTLLGVLLPLYSALRFYCSSRIAFKIDMFTFTEVSPLKYGVCFLACFRSAGSTSDF